MDSLPNASNLITPKTLIDATRVMDWARNYISKPHSDLGREGPICPFVPPSLERDAVRLALHYEVDGSCLDPIREITLHYSDVFLNQLPTKEPENIYNAIVVAFPNISDDQAVILDDLHREVKDAFVNKGLMLGQFHRHCPEPAARNPFFMVSMSDIPLVVMRYMSIHDILFLNANENWFLEYEKRFGWKYTEGKVSSPTYREMYFKTREHYAPGLSRM